MGIFKAVKSGVRWMKDVVRSRDIEGGRLYVLKTYFVYIQRRRDVFYIYWRHSDDCYFELTNDFWIHKVYDNDQ